MLLIVQYQTFLYCFYSPYIYTSSIFVYSIFSLHLISSRQMASVSGTLLIPRNTWGLVSSRPAGLGHELPYLGKTTVLFLHYHFFFVPSICVRSASLLLPLLFSHHTTRSTFSITAVYNIKSNLINYSFQNTLENTLFRLFINIILLLNSVFVAFKLINAIS